MKQNQNGEKSRTSDNAKTAITELASLVGLGKTGTAEKEVVAPVVPQVPVQEGPAETTVITKGTVLEGNLHTTGNVDCRGVVRGDLIAEGAISACGTQTGNLQGQQVYFASASIEGNVTARGLVEIDRNTKIIGDVRGETVRLDGQLTGLICATGLVSLRKHAVLRGDIQASALAVEEGAQISGKILMKAAEGKGPSPEQAPVSSAAGPREKI